MLTFSFIEINLVAVAILLIIIFNIRNKKDTNLYDQKLFRLLLYFNLVIVLLDIVMSVVNMKSGLISSWVNTIASTIYYVLIPVPCMFWSIYADFQINKDETRIKKISIPLSIPVVLNAILTFLSPRFGFLFYMDNLNTYHRGNLFNIICIICYFYFAYSSISILKNKKKLDRRQYTALIAFAFPPFFSAVFQILFYGVSIIWVSMALSSLILFLNIQNNQLYIDYLTGVYNRRQLDNYLYQKMKNGFNNSNLAGVMMDVNSFKRINDVFGHIAGDNALISVADILKKNFRKNDFVARYGGDEFVVIMEIRDKAELGSLICKLRQNVEEYNKRNNLPYQLSLSIGYDIYNEKFGTSIQKFYNHIDKLMYEDKRRKTAS